MEDDQEHLPLRVEGSVYVDIAFILQVLLNSIQRTHMKHYFLARNADKIRVFRIDLIKEVLWVLLKHVGVIFLLAEIPRDHRHV